MDVQRAEPRQPVSGEACSGQRPSRQQDFCCPPAGNDTSPESFLLHNALARKPKRIRTAFSPSQLLRLEHAFEKNHYVVGAERKQLAHSLSLTETQVGAVQMPRSRQAEAPCFKSTGQCSWPPASEQARSPTRAFGKGPGSWIHACPLVF